MKLMPIIAALVLSTVSTTIAQQQSVRTRDTASTEQAVQQQDQERIRAQIAADTIALRQIYAGDFRTRIAASVLQATRRWSSPICGGLDLHINPIGACSGFTRVAARTVADPS
jgi:hypothetical protein